MAGCLARLRGDFEQAEANFASVLTAAKRKSKLGAAGHLPAIFEMLLLLKVGTPAALAKAGTLANSATKGQNRFYQYEVAVVREAIRFRESPSSPARLAAGLDELARFPLETLLAGYLAQWFLTEEDSNFHVKNLTQSASAFESVGLDWLAAEAYALAGRSPLKTAADQAQKSGEIHARLKTASLADLIEPEPLWQQSLAAIARLAEGDAPASAAAETSERLIWEWDPRHGSIHLEPYQQKRTSSGWTKGRKVSLARLYAGYNEPDFAFVTDEDRAICRSLEMHSERNYYGYSETYVDFQDLRAARALVGHPRIFPAGDRENPFEIVEQSPKLTIVEDDTKHIRVSLDPSPKRNDEAFRVVKDGPHRVAIVFFSDRHMKLHQILGGELKVPAKAAAQVVQAIQPVTSLVTVQSEIGGEGLAGERVDADARPHVHLLPYQSGLRIEFFIRPFGEAGPFCRPGQGGANVFANIDGRALTARRDLAEEQKRLDELIAACPDIAARLEQGESIYFPTPIEALEALLQLEDLFAKDRIVMHWPQGRTLNLAGRAAAKQFRLQIRKDRDWFAASGDLKVDPSLSLDLMQLIDLVEASPGRFVQLDDGRFLALTEQLRDRIEELAAYGDRRGKQNKLRFPPRGPSRSKTWGTRSPSKRTRPGRTGSAGCTRRRKSSRKCPRRSRPNSATISRKAFRGWPGWRRGAWADASPTTWGSGKPSRRSPCFWTAPPAARRSLSLRPPWLSTGRTKSCNLLQR